MLLGSSSADRLRPLAPSGSTVKTWSIDLERSPGNDGLGKPVVFADVLCGWGTGGGGSSSYSSSSSSPQSLPSYEYDRASTQRFVLARLTFGLKEMGVPPPEPGDKEVLELEAGEALSNPGNRDQQLPARAHITYIDCARLSVVSTHSFWSSGS